MLNSVGLQILRDLQVNTELINNTFSSWSVLCMLLIKAYKDEGLDHCTTADI